MITITMIICVTILTLNNKIGDFSFGTAVLLSGIIDCVLASIIL